MDPLLVTLVATIATPITGVLGAWIGFALGRKSRPECECRRYVGDFPVDQVDWSRVQLPNAWRNRWMTS